MSTRTSLRERGEAMRQRLFGDDDGVPAVLRTLNTEASYGAIWSRPGLDRRTFLMRGAGLALSVYGASRLGIDQLEAGDGNPSHVSTRPYRKRSALLSAPFHQVTPI